MEKNLPHTLFLWIRANKSMMEAPPESVLLTGSHPAIAKYNEMVFLLERFERKNRGSQSWLRCEKEAGDGYHTGNARDIESILLVLSSIYAEVKASPKWSSFFEIDGMQPAAVKSLALSFVSRLRLPAILQDHPKIKWEFHLDLRLLMKFHGNFAVKSTSIESGFVWCDETLNIDQSFAQIFSFWKSLKKKVEQAIKTPFNYATEKDDIAQEKDRVRALASLAFSNTSYSNRQLMLKHLDVLKSVLSQRT